MKYTKATCKRCNGSGTYFDFGVCYRCNGRGREPVREAKVLCPCGCNAARSRRDLKVCLVSVGLKEARTVRQLAKRFERRLRGLARKAARDAAC